MRYEPRLDASDAFPWTYYDEQLLVGIIVHSIMIVINMCISIMIDVFWDMAVGPDEARRNTLSSGQG